jgi:repressor LexA
MSRPEPSPEPGLVIVVRLTRDGAETRATFETRLHAGLSKPGVRPRKRQREAGPVRDASRSARPTRSRSGPEIATMPVFGTIPAGPPRESFQEPIGCVQIDVETLGVRPTAQTFALLVRGDSMVGRHILDGDIVVIEAGLRARSGDVVAALVDGESTLKTLVTSEGRAFLRAENPAYSDMLAADELMIQGVMVALIRRSN